MNNIVNCADCGSPEIVKIAIRLKHVQVVHGMNVVAGLIYMSNDVGHK
jgi:hypothetical protein